jgi:hypothetical protein
LDGQLEICYQGKRLIIFQPTDQQPVRVNKFTPLSADETRKKPVQPKSAPKPKQRKPCKPAADHPWRKPLCAKQVEKSE